MKVTVLGFSKYQGKDKVTGNEYTTCYVHFSAPSSYVIGREATSKTFNAANYPDLYNEFLHLTKDDFPVDADIDFDMKGKICGVRFN